MKTKLLRYLLMLDSGVLFLLGVVLIVAPRQVERAFHFQDLPSAVSYMIGMWGCVFATMALGYALASTDPVRHVAWVEVGIARGALECIFGIVCLARGVVTFQQGGVGIIVAALITLAYLVLYPRQSNQPAPAPMQ